MMKKLLLINLLAFCSVVGKAQSLDAASKMPQQTANIIQEQLPVVRIYAYSHLLPTMVETADSLEFFPQCPALFPNGVGQLSQFIQENLHYPEELKETGQIGFVKISLMLDKQGKRKKVFLTRSEGQLMDKEALRIVNLMPDWIPAEHQGKKVNSIVNIRVTFSPKTL
jgi:TonB family protein